METVRDFIFWSSKITADGDGSHEIKRCLLLGRKAMTVQFSWSVVSDSLQPHGLQHIGLSVHHKLPELAQTHVHQVDDAIHHLILCCPSSSCPQSLPASESFPMSQLFAWGGQSTGVSASASFLPKNTQGWSPLEGTGWISLQSKGLSRVFSNTTVQKHQFFSAQLYGPTLISVHDYWKNHSFDYMDFCKQSDASAF